MQATMCRRLTVSLETCVDVSRRAMEAIDEIEHARDSGTTDEMKTKIYDVRNEMRRMHQKASIDLTNAANSDMAMKVDSLHVQHAEAISVLVQAKEEAQVASSLPLPLRPPSLGASRPPCMHPMPTPRVGTARVRPFICIHTCIHTGFLVPKSFPVTPAAHSTSICRFILLIGFPPICR